MTTVPLGRGGDPTLLLDELLWTIRDAIASQPRSQQTRIGPSEIGHPCDRWLSHKLAGTPPVNDRHAPWLPTIGTAVHAWLADVFIRLGFDAVRAGQTPRWRIEEKVTVGTINGEDIDGSCDLYDTITATVIDWKTCGKTRLDKYKRHGPDPDYRVQAHAYGRGWVHRGLPVDTVAIVFLPRNSELSETVFWAEPYDEQIVIAALARADAIGSAAAMLGPDAHALMKTIDHNCGYCPWFTVGATDLTRTCPGDPTRPKRTDSVMSLIASTQENGAT